MDDLVNPQMMLHKNKINFQKLICKIDRFHNPKLINEPFYKLSHKLKIFDKLSN